MGTQSPDGVPSSEPISYALAYFITFHTYGTWLHGTDRGSVDFTHNEYGTPVVASDERREEEEFIRLKHEPFKLGEGHRPIVERTICEVCEHRGWTLRELNVRTNHVHLVVSAPESPEKVMNDLKSHATRRLREAGLIADDAKVWSQHGSTQYLWKAESVETVCGYVRDGQGMDLPGTVLSVGRPPLPDGRGSDRSSDAVMRDVAYRVVADHVRCLTFALTDGAVPSNEGRGYVLRRILRRAVRYGRQYLGTTEPFLHKLVSVVVETMHGAFPELQESPGRIAEVILDEEASFGKTLDRGIALFEEAADYAVKHHHGRISGEDAFKLHDTYGFPIDLTELMAEERGLKVNIGEYERLMEQARERARAESKAEVGLLDKIDSALVDEAGPCDDESKYSDSLECGAIVTMANTGFGPPTTGDEFVFSTNRTCFYAEQGGQVSDVGTVETKTGEAEVRYVQRRGNRIIYFGRVVKGHIDVGQECTLRVSPVRHATMKNHTSTHVLNWALRDVLGDHVQQKGSLVDPDKTRFDLSHPSQITEEELARIEELVNRQIKDDLEVYTEVVDQAEARKVNTLRAVFGEKYPDQVRVVSIGVPVRELLNNPINPDWMNYSVEFCGGTHLKRTGEAGKFRLVEESAVAKGIRRVVGITGQRAKQAEDDATAVARLLKEAAEANDEALPQRISEITALMNQAELPIVEKSRLRVDLTHLQERAKKAAKQAAKAGAADIMGKVDDLLQNAEKVGDYSLISANLGTATVDQLRAAADSIRDRAGSAAVFLTSETSGKVSLLAAMTKDVVAKGIKAGDVVKAVAPVVGGRGGGRPDMAQGGGTEVEHIDKAVREAAEWLRAKLGE